ncbi:hypothetical protein V5O48_006420 [Marasmius crinis-equi]|uniref:Uncharacterized protein n=1 Tax=Marasmius crinis-equi TaxID=585013 RepID=A0ABR3FJH9_9AGAR
MPADVISGLHTQQGYPSAEFTDNPTVWGNPGQRHENSGSLFVFVASLSSCNALSHTVCWSLKKYLLRDPALTLPDTGPIAQEFELAAQIWSDSPKVPERSPTLLTFSLSYAVPTFAVPPIDLKRYIWTRRL